MKKHITFSLAILMGMMTIIACNKQEFKKYNNKEVVDNSYTGTVEITSGGSDPAGDFTGNGDSGTYSFVWENNQKRASLDFDITTSSGSVQMILQDALGEEVLNKTRVAGANDSFSGVSEKGEPGKWLVTLILEDFNGDGSFSMHPGD